MSSVYDMAVPGAEAGGSAEMKKRLGAIRSLVLGKGRTGTRRCPCCASARCVCEDSCDCQNLKAATTEDETDEAGFDGEIRGLIFRPRFG